MDLVKGYIKAVEEHAISEQQWCNSVALKQWQTYKTVQAKWQQSECTWEQNHDTSDVFSWQEFKTCTCTSWQQIWHCWNLTLNKSNSVPNQIQFHERLLSSGSLRGGAWTCNMSSASGQTVFLLSLLCFNAWAIILTWDQWMLALQSLVWPNEACFAQMCMGQELSIVHCSMQDWKIIWTGKTIMPNLQSFLTL